jgi:predicted component of type VI protein secretion system
MARLVLLSEGMTGTTHELKVEKTTVGRVDDNTFVIPDGSVSSHHCEIILRGAAVIVRDLNSTNGTFINGAQVNGDAPIKGGQILRLGQVEMRLEDDAAKQPSPKKLPLGAEPQTKAVAFDKTTFAKKSNVGAKVFLGVAIVAGLGVVAYIVMAVLKQQ